jgi:1,4-alpha-glucan branching enzyme
VIDSTSVKAQHPLVGSEAPHIVEEFRWEKSGSRDVTLSARAPGAASVEVTGDFTNWSPVRLVPAANAEWWSVTLPLRPGKYQMNLRVDGGKWLVPPGVLSMRDEFGGTVGLLVVE